MTSQLLPSIAGQRLSLVGEVDTIAMLRALPAPQLPAGRTTLVYVGGYYSAGDGGEGTFRWQGNSNQADDGGYIIQPNSLVGAGRWIRSNAGEWNPMQFGATGLGIADDSVAMAAAFKAAIANRSTVYVPPGNYRVTSGYINAVANGDIRIRGAGQPRVGVGGSTITLDSADPASFFFKSTANQCVQVSDLQLQCAQFVQDRRFFYFGANTNQFFTRVSFEAVERPVVWAAGSYFQNASYRDVQFRNSGTFHSEAAAGTLIGTLLTLDNVNHEANVPVNTESILCNLNGIRQIQGRNFLLEGFGPGAGWTILSLGETYDSNWIDAPTANFDGFWIEFSGAGFTTPVAQNGGTVTIRNSNPFMTAAAPYALSNKGKLILDVANFTGSVLDPANAITFGDAYCRATFRNAAVRSPFALVRQQITYEDCSYASSDNNVSNVQFSNDAPQLLYEFDGKPFDSSLVSAAGGGGTTMLSETDATYGRRLSVYPSANAIFFQLLAKGFNGFSAGDQFFIKIKMQLPVWTSGSIQLRASSDVTASIASINLDQATYSGQLVTLTLPFNAVSAPANVGLVLTTVGVTAIANPIMIYHMQIGRGTKLSNTYRTAFPSNITFRATAVPSTGTWAKGDRAENSAPAVGSPKAWSCTVAGTPGTWVSEGNL